MREPDYKWRGYNLTRFPTTVTQPASAPRAPWWMYVIAASLLGCLAMEVHVFFWGPETPFTRIQTPRRGGLPLVSPGTAAARAGVRAGDRIISFAGRRTGAWQTGDMVRLNVEANHPYALRIDRGGQHEELTLTLGRRSWTLLPLFQQLQTIVGIGCGLCARSWLSCSRSAGPAIPLRVWGRWSSHSCRSKRFP